MKFLTFTEEAYHALIEDKVFEIISGSPAISEQSWKAFEAGNISQFIFDVQGNVQPDAFEDFGLDNVNEHQQALALAKMIQEFGF